jgi:hypothetical protein
MLDLWLTPSSVTSTEAKTTDLQPCKKPRHNLTSPRTGKDHVHHSLQLVLHVLNTVDDVLDPLLHGRHSGIDVCNVRCEVFVMYQEPCNFGLIVQDVNIDILDPLLKVCQ